MDAAAFLRERNRTDVTLPSGLNVTIRLPDLIDCMMATDIPVPILDEIDRIEHLEEDRPANGQRFLEPEKVKETRRLHDELVRRAIVRIEGEEVEMTLEAVAELDRDDYAQVRAYAMTTTPLPKAGAPA